MKIASSPSDRQAVFDAMYLAYHPLLNKYAYALLKDGDMAEDTVHNVFLKLLESQMDLAELQQPKAYLYRSVYNEAMNCLKHRQIEQVYEDVASPKQDEEMKDSSSSVQYKELKVAVAAALNQLPEQCRTVFQLSRYEELKYKEIALELDISVNTVEKHMVKALNRLRTILSDYLPLLTFWLFLIVKE
ncbi:RNA polymerase sigma-70 factor [Pedobacter sp. MC2016-14]|uniref:RNA polymerase sigma-70 factor n=1 Tax=Pedobacter sp. MC2016-14 TaxID=2897327 RepID=UPI001E325EAD|nr:RNA polymerase sigma-70 factor [Pedobacter sp. MC2016-14]MCD0489212.1 RNA polymerase sigma-70 factor [Pedobacter sp. MC2016-14]